VCHIIREEGDGSRRQFPHSSFAAAFEQGTAMSLEEVAEFAFRAIDVGTSALQDDASASG